MRITATMEIPRKNPNPPDPIFHSEYTTEKKWQAAVTGWFKQMGNWMCYHTHISAHSAGGFPDLVCAHRTVERVVWAELKSETGIVTETQAGWMHVLAGANQEVYLWRPSDTDEIQAVLQQVNDDAFSRRERGILPTRSM